MVTSFATLEVTKVNTYGIVLRWEGLDPFLYPVLITAHQGIVLTIASPMSSDTGFLSDVVPVNPGTANDWVHPPYSGHYDGKPMVAGSLEPTLTIL